jgi:hypothetical protein
MIATHMERLAKQLEIDVSLAVKDRPGVFFFPVDDTLDVTITDLSPGVLFDCELAPLPEKNKVIFYTNLMVANLFGQSTYGAELGISKNEKTLILQYHLDYDPDFKEFDEKLEDFLNAADFWRGEAKAAS